MGQEGFIKRAIKNHGEAYLALVVLVLFIAFIMKLIEGVAYLFRIAGLYYIAFGLTIIIVIVYIINYTLNGIKEDRKFARDIKILINKDNESAKYYNWQTECNKAKEYALKNRHNLKLSIPNKYDLDTRSCEKGAIIVLSKFPIIHKLKNQYRDDYKTLEHQIINTLALGKAGLNMELKDDDFIFENNEEYPPYYSSPLFYMRKNVNELLEMGAQLSFQEMTIVNRMSSEDLNSIYNMVHKYKEICRHIHPRTKYYNTNGERSFMKGKIKYIYTDYKLTIPFR